jgi:hypothetical protein
MKIITATAIRIAGEPTPPIDGIATDYRRG